MTDRTLSPAAQAVLDGFRAVPSLMDAPSIAGALRAAAEQLGYNIIYDDDEQDYMVDVADLLAIAAELEGAND
jgi:hypothetical protein